MTRNQARTYITRCVVPCILVPLLGAWPPAMAQGPAGLQDDTFALHLLGEWSGSGVYEGSRLDLTRAWNLEFGAAFLKVDMAVSMPNGGSFGGLMYWRASGQGRYEIVWLDGSGRMQRLQAQTEGSLVWSEYVDEFTASGAEPRRWEFAPTGPDSYLERVLVRREGSWELLTEWRFKRME